MAFTKGHKHSPETIAKIRAAKTGKPLTAAHKAALSQAKQSTRDLNERLLAAVEQAEAALAEAIEFFKSRQQQ
ncbi:MULTISPECIES: NUMOD3 domain-containing DNA-binding protein [unclassified Rhizobium]|uniref:NUMOD3 domain-containing DNA-binding protein n=1 Tax=unclassified Rhizobium TaxID=2613769 RepID=UPI00115E0BA4|nr:MULTISPECIES: NUMOD3 domain-containing DNA-binding protein [unclassified Rhizobium]TQX90246.1 hypothetical protein EQW76_11120 [Rhizobium sp. rho-13.1]TQY16196.1 hypothetical protein EQW74_10710 [Rhizobium sp. rho-1.1]